MLDRFFPKAYFPSVHEVDYDALQKQGICGLIFDIDNTLVTFDIEKPPDELAEFLRGLVHKGFKVCLLSNNSHRRVQLFNEGLDFFAVGKAGKPRKRGVLRAISHLNLPKENIALVGDQMFTDVWCGNRCGIHTVLVKPISTKDEWTVRLKRIPEKWLLKTYLKGVRR